MSNKCPCGGYQVDDDFYKFIFVMRLILGIAFLLILGRLLT